jgi:hypothetical protein
VFTGPARDQRRGLRHVQEAGGRGDRSLPAGIDHDVVVPALRRSLGTWTEVASYAGEGELRLNTEQEGFIQPVTRALDDLDDGTTNE